MRSFRACSSIINLDMPIGGAMHADPVCYEIRVRGQLDITWQDRFDSFEMRHTHGETVLTGSVIDQAALFGLLIKIHNLGLILIAVNRLHPLEINRSQTHG
jgi:hypothetical protein